MRFLSVCSGVEAASLAWHPLGWATAAVSEVDPFPCAVLSHRYPGVPNLGDMTAIPQETLDDVGAVDVLVGGTPCQSYSVAGQRGGIEDPRGALALAFGDIATRSGARWLVWENVRGVLTTNRGRDFGLFARSMVERGYHLAYRVLDARGFGVPQQRRRVFVVGHLGDGHGPEAVLSERPRRRGHHPPCREAGSGGTRAGHAGVAVYDGGAAGERSDIPCLTTGSGRRYDLDTEAFVINGRQDPGTVRGYAPAFGTRDTGHAVVCPPPECLYYTHAVGQDRVYGTGGSRRVQVTSNGSGCRNILATLTASTGGPDDNDARGGRLVPDGPRIRRLTPVECERAQGMPDNWTRIPWRGRPEEECPDGHRYKAIGNSMAVPVMRWIGERIAAWERGERW